MRPLRELPRYAHANRRGISLPVVLFVLCLVGVLATIAIPRFFERDDITLDNACRLLSRDLRAVQNRAALHKIGARLVIDADGWRALDSSGQPIEGIGESHPIIRRFSHDGVFEGVRVIDVACGPDNAIGVDSRGLVSAPCELVFQFRDHTRRVEVERGGGQVLVYRAADEAPTEANASE